MHIVEGALSNSVVIGGAVPTVAGIAKGLRELDMERIPTAGVLSATFFVAALVHVPIGLSSVHLIMNGLAGVLLGGPAQAHKVVASAGVEGTEILGEVGFSNGKTAPPGTMVEVFDRALIAETVRQELQPLRREIVQLKEQSGLQQILGGMGYIAGLFGLLFFVHGRRPARG
jgi:cobalt/nickel transport system permease protein